MAKYNDNLLQPFYYWSTYYCTKYGTSPNYYLYGQASYSYAYWSYNTTGFDTNTSALVTLPGCTGKWYLDISFIDSQNSLQYTETIPFDTTEKTLPIVLEDSNTTQIRFTVRCASSGYCYLPSFQLIETPIRSVDIEYATGTSKTVAPTTGWQTTAPSYSTSNYIWQRTATTFIDGHTEYSSPVMIQQMYKAIYSIVEQYYLSTSQTSATGGSWSTTCPTWQSGRYIWTRSYITYMDQTTGYTTPVLAQALNQANSVAQEAKDEAGNEWANLTQKQVFDKLTNNSTYQGLFFEPYSTGGSTGRVYINATYINAGTLTVADSNNYTLFSASVSNKTVYIAGFTVQNGKMYCGSCTNLGYKYSGVYIGTDGITTGSGNIHITLSGGKLWGGPGNSSQTGFIDFDNYWSATKEYSIRVGGQGCIVFATNRLTVLGYYSTSGTWTVTEGQTGNIQVPDYSWLQNKYLVYGMSRSYGVAVSSISYSYTNGYIVMGYSSEQVVESIQSTGGGGIQWWTKNIWAISRISSSTYNITHSFSYSTGSFVNSLTYSSGYPGSTNVTFKQGLMTRSGLSG